MIPFDPTHSTTRGQAGRRGAGPGPRSSRAADPYMLSWPALERHFEAPIARSGRSLFEQGAVHDLARTPDGELVARVHVDRVHIVNVGTIAGIISADCTCPEELDCEHGVAVLLQYQALVGQGEPIPTVPTTDPRVTGEEQRELFGSQAGLDSPDGDGEPVRLVLPDDVRAYLRGLPGDALAELVEKLASTRSDVYDELVETYQNQHGSTEDLVEAAKLAIEDLEAPDTSESLSDLTHAVTRLDARLQAIVERGHADDALDLYRELLVQATDILAAFDLDDDLDADEVEATGDALRRPFEALPAALERSSLEPAARLLWLVDLYKLDGENVASEPTYAYWQEERPAAVWSDVADGITALLDETTVTPRDRPALVPSSPLDFLTDDDVPSIEIWRTIAMQQLVHALTRADRQDEIAGVLIRQAETTGNVISLARHLIGIGELDEAERWLRRCMTDEQSSVLDVLRPERELLGEIYERRQDPAELAAFYADRFFRLPSLTSYQPLIETARQLGLDAPVRQHAIRYLERLQLPWDTQQGRHDAALPPWPLPDLGLPEPQPAMPARAPLADHLIDVLLAEDDPESALRWYERARGQLLGPLGEVETLTRITQALEPTQPERSVSLLMDRARVFLDRGSPPMLEAASGLLEAAGWIEHRRGRLAAWLQTMSGLRHRHRKHTRVRQTLDDVLARLPSA